MRLGYTPSFGEAYSSVIDDSLLTTQDIEDTKKFLRDDAPEIFRTFKKEIIEAKVGGRVVRALFSKGEDEHTIIIPAEYGTGLGRVDDRDAVMRAYAMRYQINPNASFLYVPNNVAGENNLNFSAEEREIVRGTDTTPGNFNPLVDRVKAMLESQDVMSDQLTGVGNSHGAAVITALAASGEVNMHSLSTFLPPDVIARQRDELVKAFLSGGKNLFTNIEISKLGTESTFLNQHVGDLLQFAVNAVGKNNRATMGPLLAGQHEAQLRQALTANPKLAVVRGWVPNAPISPADANVEVGERLEREFENQVENHKIPGEKADATSANVFLISAGLAKRAFILANKLEAA